MVSPIIASTGSKEPPSGSKRGFVANRSVELILSFASIRLWRLGRSQDAQDTGPFPVGVFCGVCFLLKNNIFIANRADERTVGGAILPQESVEAHDAAATNGNPYIRRRLRGHIPPRGR